MKILRLLFFFFLISSLAGAQDGHPMEMEDSQDREQQQLEWCFVYSNMFGYEIEYINNPRLFQSIGEWMGTPYKYSGESEKGIDCSGFVCRMMQDSYHILLTGSARDIYKKVNPIKKGELREGDLVFFKIKKGRISHVGIYLGQNKFAHASTQLGVTISDLTEPYYQKYFYQAGRIKS
ncbi:MAG: C40 family peptidase [Bacteroidetes bacterium]|nr:C40 family peptidase [Bacteroidota bacterium]MBL0063751.1 C40 family peptidase [Bacteroidota bacterium]